ncbi:MAG: DUF3187 family protein [Geopsychrobacter sp.]|nr:DUF3187 family protein [Geopsychrobacter sp.]
MILKWLAVSLLWLCCAGTAAGFELQPLTTRNLSPATLGFGLPALGAARLLPGRTGRAQFTFDLVSNFSESVAAGERLRFDGETYRAALSADYGIGSNFEVGAELPLLSHSGGFLDGFVEGWHDTFGLPQGGRDLTASDQLDYSYAHGGDGFSLQSEQAGIGDLSLRAAWQCWQDVSKSRALALRVSLKLPTGSVSHLTGSGSTDLALWLSGEQRLQAGTGVVTLYGGGGGLFSTDGDLLPEQRRNLAGLVSFGVGWRPWMRLGLQLQFDGHSALFKGSQLRELNEFAGQLASGGSFVLTDATIMELAVVEDVLVNTAPDVVFHLALKRNF